MSVRTRVHFTVRNFAWNRFLSAPCGSKAERFWIRLHNRL